MKNKTIELAIFNEVGKNTVTTTEVIKTSFKNVFEKLKKNNYVVIENSRQHKKMVLVDLNDYVELLQKVEDYKEKMFDEAAAEYVTSGEHKFIKASDANI